MNLQTLSPRFVAVLAFVALLAASCRELTPALLFERTVFISPQNNNPSLASRSESGTIALSLDADNVLSYSIVVSNLSPVDTLLFAHIHTGNPAENGDVLVTLVDNINSKFDGTKASGTVTLTSAQADAIVKNPNGLYANVHSSLFPGGLARGTVGADMAFAQDVVLDSAAAGRAESGLAVLRLLSNGTLYSNITIDNLATGDALLFAHVHDDRTGSTMGAVMFDLCKAAADFGVVQKNTLTEEQQTSLKTVKSYVNVHSEQVPQGLVRGQIR